MEHYRKEGESKVERLRFRLDDRRDGMCVRYGGDVVETGVFLEGGL
jgi:hypothetical protein